MHFTELGEELLRLLGLQTPFVFSFLFRTYWSCIIKWRLLATLFSSHYGVIRVLLGQEDKSPSSLTLDASINSLEKWFTMNCYLSSPISLCNLPPVVLPCGLAGKVSTLSLLM